MGRRLARESALQVLFQIDVGKVVVDQALSQVFAEFAVHGSDQTFAKQLVEGALENQAQLDEIIDKMSVDWELDRLARVDHNILRLALYEMYYREDIPANVSVNEAVELAKTFSTAESGKFVNGILGKIIVSPDSYRPAQS